MRLPHLLLTADVAAAAPALASAEEPVQAIILVDVIPPDMAQGRTLLSDFVRRARQDPALRSVVLIQQTGISNHFMLEESFGGEAARRRFVQKPHVREFRTALSPHLGSPWDERSDSAVSP